jgi:hypothetical protein
MEIFTKWRHQQIRLIGATIATSEFRMDTFFCHWQLSALGNLDVLVGLVAGTLWHVLNLLNDFVALEYFPEDDMFTVKPSVSCQNDDRSSKKRTTHGVKTVVMKN